MPQNLHDRPSTHRPLDQRAARRAHIRAIAAGLVDGPRMGRRFHIPAGVPLQQSSRRRHSSSAREKRTDERHPRPMRRRLFGAAFLVIQVGALAALLTAPAFRVHHIAVKGDHLLNRDTLLAAAGVPQSSLFTVDGDAIQTRLTRLPWVRAAVVTTQLPSTVDISVTEWQPALLLRHATASSFVAANGATLPFTQSTASARRGVPLLLDYRTGAEQPLMQGLAEILASAASRWQATYGCSVDAFVLSTTNLLSAWCSTGWQAVFGTVDSSDAVAAIPQQLAVLAALKGRVDFLHPAFGYVDLENPAAPAAGGHPGEPPSVRADIDGSAHPSPVSPALVAPSAPVAAPPTAAVPTMTPAPTPRPTPSPVVLRVAPPTPSAPH